MESKSPSLKKIIIDKIHQEGPISFRDFMEMALYYPELGYYTSAGNKIGKTGDYYTGSNLSPVLGEMIGRQLEEMWHILGKNEFTVIEMGAGTGLLSKDVIGYLKKNQEFYHKLEYCIIEKSLSMREEQRKILKDKVRWRGDTNEISGITGCIFSNELIDAFPVHLVEMKKKLMEVFLDYEDNKFIEILKPASLKLTDYLSELEVSLPECYRTEINLEAIKCVEEIAAWIAKGFVITIDYGYPSTELYQDYRSSGTLMCYHNHIAVDDPYRNIGEQDITSHVNFSALEHWGSRNGLEYCGFTDQAHFLLGLGIEEYLEGLQKNNPVDYLKKMLPIKTLMMDMGEMFKILIQKKGVDCKYLSGLKFPGRLKI